MFITVINQMWFLYHCIFLGIELCSLLSVQSIVTGLGILRQTVIFCINSASVLCLSMIHYTVSSAFGCCKPWLVTAVLQVTFSSPKLMHYQQVVVGPVQNTA